MKNKTLFKIGGGLAFSILLGNIVMAQDAIQKTTTTTQQKQRLFKMMMEHIRNRISGR